MTDLIVLEPRQADQWRAWIEHWLLAHGGWHTSQHICAATGGRLDDRTLRHVISSSDCIISSHKGFRHIEHATAEEIRHFLNDMLSRARALGRRYAAVRRRAHKLIG